MMKPNKLKTLLFERDLSQKDLHKMIEETSIEPISRQLLNLIVNGKQKNYQTTTIMKICRALEITPNELLNKSDYDYLFKD